MLKIEVIKFEVQDIITTSDAGIDGPVKEEVVETLPVNGPN